jgi:hypothetical protein
VAVGTLWQEVTKLIIDLPHEQFKNENRRFINELMEPFGPLLEATRTVREASEMVDRFQMQVTNKCIQSPNMEKRLSSLGDIREFVRDATSRPVTRWITPE